MVVFKYAWVVVERQRPASLTVTMVVFKSLIDSDVNVAGDKFNSNNGCI